MILSRGYPITWVQIPPQIPFFLLIIRNSNVYSKKKILSSTSIRASFMLSNFTLSLLQTGNDQEQEQEDSSDDNNGGESGGTAVPVTTPPGTVIPGILTRTASVESTASTIHLDLTGDEENPPVLVNTENVGEAGVTLARKNCETSEVNSCGKRKIAANIERELKEYKLRKTMLVSCDF